MLLTANPNPINVGAGDMVGLIAAINQANSDSLNNLDDTIVLANSTYTSSGSVDSTNGPNALPVITATNLTIHGNGSTLDGAFMGRLFDVGSGAGVTLDNLTITDGLAVGSHAQGGGLFNDGGTVTMNNVTFSNDIAIATGQTTAGAGNNAQGGGIYSNGGSLTLTNVNFQNGTVSAASGTGVGRGGNAQGGGIYVTGATLTLSGGLLSAATVRAGNASVGSAGGTAAGGSIYAENSNVTLTGGATIINNDVFGGGSGPGLNSGLAQGGGLFINGGSVTVTGNAAITTNTAHGGPGGGEADGGGLAAINAQVTVNGGATIDHNSALAGAGNAGSAGGVAQGGGIFASGTSTVALGDATSAATISLNTATGGSGGAGATGGTGTGGGITILGAPLTLTNAIVESNTVKGGQAGFEGNGGDAEGGGLFISGINGSNSATVLNSTFFDNVASAQNAGTGVIGLIGGTAQGGGIYTASSTLSVLNSTFADNAAAAGTNGLPPNTPNGGGAGQGGGLFATSGTLTLINDTIASNFIQAFTDRGTSAGEGAGVYAAPNTLNLLENTIIALDEVFSDSTHSTTPSFNSDLVGTAVSSDHNLIGTDPQFLAPTATNSLGLSGLLPVAAPGQLTPTLPVAWNSPAVAQGNAAAATTIANAEGFTDVSQATDQRGLPRVINGMIDIGATQNGLLVSGTAPTTVTAGQNITYTLTVTNNGPNALTNVTLSDPLPANTTFVSATTPAGWTPTTPAVGQNGTVSFNIGTLAANTTATFTVVVQVASNATGGSNIANTATITYTGDVNPVSPSVTLNTQVAGSTTTDITSQIGIISTPIFPNVFVGPTALIQFDLFINGSGKTYTGPIALVLMGLPAGVTLTNATGTDSNGNPYIDIVSANGTWNPGLFNAIIAALEFNDPSHTPITYTPHIVQGI
ncbi:MAG TPA: DUF11 domain-containing protein [Gemmataceae bacterium]|nr:DUF11 domain-containing protein [Gemmataceae bacterium]